MKTTLLGITGAACLLTSGLAMTEAEKPTTLPGPETLRGQGGAITDMDTVGADHPRSDMDAGPRFKSLDVNQDWYLNAYELGGYEVGEVDDETRRERGRSLISEFDIDNDSLVSPDEFRAVSGDEEELAE